MNINTPMTPSGSLLPLETLEMETFSPSLADSSLWLRGLPHLPMEDTVLELPVISSQWNLADQPTWRIPTIQARSIVYKGDLLDQQTIEQIMRERKPVYHRESRLPLAIVLVLMSTLTTLTFLEIFYPHWLH